MSAHPPGSPPAPPDLDQRRVARLRPDRSPVMFQRWSELLFLHWRWDPAEIQATLPPGLWVDTFEGEAWMGVVPFWMDRVRPRFLPPVPGLSWFLELNLRTYVYDRDGRPGVWFYSLDCNQSLAVRIARTLFGLNYVHARQAGQRGDPTESRPAEFHSVRRATGGESHYRYASAEAPQKAEPGTLEFFLVERYALFSRRRDCLYHGRIWHEPYHLSPVHVHQAKSALWVDQGFLPPEREADHALMSRGVDVCVYPMEALP